MLRWWIVGLAFTAGGLGVLYVLHDVLRLSLIAATSVSSEVLLLLRFVIQDRWVFGHPRPTWKRLWQFHVASAGGGIIWWAVTNLLPRFGVHYLLAAIAATGCSVFFSMATNFFWIWRGRASGSPALDQPYPETGRQPQRVLESTPRCGPTDGIKSTASE